MSASKNNLSIDVGMSSLVSEKDQELLAAFKLHRYEFEAWLAERRARQLAEDAHKAAYEAREARRRADEEAFANNAEWTSERIDSALKAMRENGDWTEINLLRATVGGREWLYKNHGGKCPCWISRGQNYPGSPCSCAHEETYSYEHAAAAGSPSHSPTSPSYQPSKRRRAHSPASPSFHPNSPSS